MTVVPPGEVAAKAVSNARGISRALDHEPGLDPGVEDLLRGVCLVGAEAAGVIEFLLQRVHGDDPRDSLRDGGDERRHAHPAEADDHDAVLRAGPGRVEHRAAAGQHGAAQDCRNVRGDVVVHRHGGSAVHDGVGGEAGDAQVVVDGLAVAAQEPGSVQQGPVVVALGPCRAGQPAVLGAVRAVLAAGQEGHDHALAGLQVRDAGTDLDDAARGLVAQQHGNRPDPVAVDDAQVRVADSGGLHPDKDLGGPGSRQFQLGDADRPGLREGAGAADFLKYCTGDLHRSSFAAWSGLSER